MRLEDGTERREAERDRGGGGKWDGGRFKSYNNGARLSPWPPSCKPLNVIMTTKGELACPPASNSLGSRGKKMSNCHQHNWETRKQPWKIK